MSWRRKSAIVRYLLVFLIVLIPISLNAQTPEPFRDSGVVLEKELVKGDRAPFGGVLVPWPQYYYYNEQVELNFNHEAHPVECDSCVSSLVMSAALFFVIGFGSKVALDAVH